jgi:SRSO17 transposase
MDVAEQVCKHLPRTPEATIPLVDQYCTYYQDLFPDVRSYENFKLLHLGIISNLKRKSLPELEKVVGVSSQSLHHFLSQSPWSLSPVEQRRLNKLVTILQEEKIILVVDETGDRKKGKKTDYTARQYLGNVGKIDHGIVSVNVYGIYQNITFPLMTRIYKPKSRLKVGDKYKTKTEIAGEMVRELKELGFKIKLVLADSLYGESSTFLKVLEELKLEYVVSIRNNHGVWMASNQRIRANKWCKFTRQFSDGKTEIRYIREIIYGKKGRITYWEMTTDTETLPLNSSSFVMTNCQGNLKKRLGDLYGQRTWIEYGFRQCKQELGWKDYRLTKIESIEKWWSIINSVYTMISLQTKPFKKLLFSEKEKKEEEEKIEEKDHINTWKKSLKKIMMMIEPLILFWLITPWLKIANSSLLLEGFNNLLSIAHSSGLYFPTG